MEPAERYEIVNTLATGEFATVCRARDRELGREVAVKQIHAQFLADPRQLTRYWQEAQLLAGLQHPNILTIYDIVRARGWLILELMRGSLKPAAEGHPLDLDLLRAVLVSCLEGLRFLHANGILHGDVKPSNILIGVQRQIKLGDFGLARRASNEEGSLLKGTTKYMAPELLSPQLGATGPAADLYSLGFTAYELLCGAKFESLLPTLATFGRNKQMAWMMWHSTADVKLPEISRVLAGVPADLAHVIETLIVKDPSRRYATAEAALADLRPGPVAASPGQPDAAAEVAVAVLRRRRRLLRRLSLVAAALFVALSLAVGLMKKPAPPPAKPQPPFRGVVTNVYPGEMKFAATSPADGLAHAFHLTPHDRILINGESRLLDELAPRDNVIVETVVEAKSKRPIQEVHAFRPKSHTGRIATVKADESSLLLAVDEGEDAGKELAIAVPADLKITINGRAELDGKPVRLADLRAGDRATVGHIGEETGQRATALEIERVEETRGVLAEDFTPRPGLLCIITGEGTQQQVLRLPLARQFVISINGHPAAQPTSLKKDDRVTVRHDTHVLAVEAQRSHDTPGFVEQIRYEPPQSLSVHEEGGGSKTYLVGSPCAITLGSESVALDVLRPGDVVRITHAAVEPGSQDAVVCASIAATRPVDPTRWAILIAIQDYDDNALSPLSYPAADAKLLADTLVRRYRLPADHAVLMVNDSLVRLEQTFPEQLRAIAADARLIVFFAGHACKDEQGVIDLAPKNFDSHRVATTGLPLQWLVDRLEECKAKEKLLLLDAAHGGGGPDLAREPSSAEMLRSLQPHPNRALLQTITAVASCRAGQRGLDWPSKGHGLFAWCLAEGYSGLADANRDTRLEPTELFDYLQKTMPAAAAQMKGVQTPELFLPDDRPPRLSDAAKKAIRGLAAHFGQSKFDDTAVRREYAGAEKEAGKEVEPRLLYGLLLIKAKHREAAMKVFEDLKSDQPALLLPLRAIAWLDVDKRNYPLAGSALAELINKVPKPQKAADPYSPEAKSIFLWAGQLRQFMALTAQDSSPALAESLANVDAAVATHRAEAGQLYAQGRQHSESVAADFDQRIAAATDEAGEKILKVQRRLVSHYSDFPLDKLSREILAGLEQ
jgi:serine/threonine-protein kinase